MKKTDNKFFWIILVLLIIIGILGFLFIYYRKEPFINNVEKKCKDDNSSLIGNGFSLYGMDVIGPQKIDKNIEKIKTLAKNSKLSRLIIGFLHLGKGKDPILGPDGKNFISPNKRLTEGAAKGIPISNPQIGFIPCSTNNKNTCWPSYNKESSSFLNLNNGTVSNFSMKTGDILYNNYILIQDGKPYDIVSFNKWKNHLKELNDMGIELSWSIGGAMNSDFLNFLVTGVDENGFSTSSTVYKNFKALYTLLPFVNWLDLDLENHLSDPTHLAKLWKSLHVKNKISISPYTPPPPQFNNSQFSNILTKGLVDLVNLQCYCGGMQPPSFICNATIQYWDAKNIPISIGFCQTNDCGNNCPQIPTIIASYLISFKKTIKNLKGFFIWNLDAVLNDPNSNDILSSFVKTWGSVKYCS